jgi:NADPH:quinone reductase-like Zn-dependent oxidoreductase
MKAVVCERYGSPDVLELREVDKPIPADDEVLVRVRATSVNPVDWHGVTGTPYIARLQTGLRGPKSAAVGVDFAGQVEAVGRDVTVLASGDDVFGGRNGAFAEYVCVRNAVAVKPSNLTFEQAAAVPVAAITALQGLRDKGALQPGQKVLVNGASGGVGTVAVQIAKALGAEVTGVCSTGNVELVRSLGADHVVDYTGEDFTRRGEQYDLLLDNAGSRSFSAYRRVLRSDGRLVIVGGPKTSKLLGPLTHMVTTVAASKFRSQKAVAFLAKLNKEDLRLLRELLEAGTVRPVIDRTYELAEIADALRYLGEGHARGKIVVTV